MFPLTLRIANFGVLNNKQITFIINQRSGTLKGELIEEKIIDGYTINKHSAELIYTEHRDHASELD